MTHNAVSFWCQRVSKPNLALAVLNQRPEMATHDSLRVQLKFHGWNNHLSNLASFICSDTQNTSSGFARLFEQVSYFADLLPRRDAMTV